jgi:hypothetical protein
LAWRPGCGRHQGRQHHGHTPQPVSAVVQPEWGSRRWSQPLTGCGRDPVRSAPLISHSRECRVLR